MKVIVLAGSANTGKTYTLSLVVDALVNNYGARLIKGAMPVQQPPNAYHQHPFYNDAVYALQWNAKKIIISTAGDKANYIEQQFNTANGNADVFITASHAQSQSTFMRLIDKWISAGNIVPEIVASLDHSDPVKQAAWRGRVDQIIRMI